MILALFEDMNALGWTMIAIWGVIFIATLVIELSTADLTTIWFCIASAITLVCAAMKAHPGLQVGIFVFLSITLVLATRPLTKKMMQTEIIHTNADKIIDMVGHVITEIPEDGIGEIKVDNNVWRAISNDGAIMVGEKVTVKSISGNKVVVSKIDSKSDEIKIL